MSTKESWIPQLTEAEAQKLFERIKPVVRFADGEQGSFRSQKGFLHYIAPCDLFSTAYTWDPKPAERVTAELTKLADIKTYHTYAYYGFFKPSIAEVLAQIPKDMVEKVKAFEIVAGPEDASDLNRESAALNAGYHVATTRLYC